MMRKGGRHEDKQERLAPARGERYGAAGVQCAGTDQHAGTGACPNARPHRRIGHVHHGRIDRRIRLARQQAGQQEQEVEAGREQGGVGCRSSRTAAVCQLQSIKWRVIMSAQRLEIDYKQISHECPLCGE